jgi:rubrerythrin
MSNIFAASEIVEIGIQIEINGRDFYNTLAGKFEDQKAKGLFKYLADEEEKHIAVFQKILESVDKYEPVESYPGEYFSYMKNLAAEHVFTRKNEGSKIAGKVKTEKEALDLGIGFEKDSIIFYLEMKQMVSQNQYKVIDQLIAQEQGHLRKLTELKAQLR